MTNKDFTFELFDLDITKEQIKELKAFADIKGISFQDLVEGMIKNGIQDSKSDS
jgi:hypothetical protein